MVFAFYRSGDSFKTNRTWDSWESPIAQLLYGTIRTDPIYEGNRNETWIVRSKLGRVEEKGDRTARE